MRMRTILMIGAVAAGLALTACGAAGGPASGTHRETMRGAFTAVLQVAAA